MANTTHQGNNYYNTSTSQQQAKETSSSLNSNASNGSNGSNPNQQQTNSTVSSSDRCSICLCPLEDPSRAEPCGHLFCYECITHWVVQRNHCPLCRQVIRSLLHIGENRSEPISVPESQLGFVQRMGHVTIVHTPMDGPLYVVQPVPVPDTAVYAYLVRALEPDRHYFMMGVTPGTLWVLPCDLERVTSTLRAYGLRPVQSGVHSRRHEQHATFLGMHPIHPRGGNLG